MKCFCENANVVVIDVATNRRFHNVVDDNDNDNNDNDDNNKNERRRLLKRRCEKNVAFIKTSFARFRTNIRVFRFFSTKFKNVRTIDCTIVKNDLLYEFVTNFNQFNIQNVIDCMMFKFIQKTFVNMLFKCAFFACFLFLFANHANEKHKC